LFAENLARSFYGFEPDFFQQNDFHQSSDNCSELRDRRPGALAGASAGAARAASLQKCLLVTSALLCAGSPRGGGWLESCVTSL
jgi:hypothetical protein